MNRSFLKMKTFLANFQKLMHAFNFYLNFTKYFYIYKSSERLTTFITNIAREVLRLFGTHNVQR